MYALRRSLDRKWFRPLRLFPNAVQPRQLSTQTSLRQKGKKGQDVLPPDAPTAKHHDLASFLDYADRTGLDTASTIYVGTHYEYSVSSTLSQYGIQAMRVGGVSDYGVDLLGHWKLPSRKNSLKLIFQCKGGAQKVTPAVTRELEGAFIGAPVGWRGEGVIAFLVSTKTASKGVREGLGRSRWPMGFISCSEDGIIRQMLWNQRAEEEGLRGVNVTMRHPKDGAGESQVVLTYKGKRVGTIVDSTVVEGGEAD
ncbi:hypothetical protein CKAH01_17416 [Colletotrichum kahawae]|uniref:Uncharacterized protein n=1 Tax=Colletotrichum kahawae TaxID=34407 RepID=A0AAD9Y9F3_COLKA|nr:hypothetical protein CKAH01_17416 [Colletotrichum kahawae]